MTQFEVVALGTAVDVSAWTADKHWLSQQDQGFIQIALIEALLPSKLPRQAFTIAELDILISQVPITEH